MFVQLLSCTSKSWQAVCVEAGMEACTVGSCDRSCVHILLLHSIAMPQNHGAYALGILELLESIGIAWPALGAIFLVSLLCFGTGGGPPSQCSSRNVRHHVLKLRVGESLRAVVFRMERFRVQGFWWKSG